MVRIDFYEHIQHYQTIKSSKLIMYKIPVIYHADRGPRGLCKFVPRMRIHLQETNSTKYFPSRQ